MKASAFSALLLTTLLVSGCGVNDGDFIGTWTSKTEVTDTSQDPQEQAFAEAMTNAMAMTIELKKDGVASGTIFGMKLDGTWERADRKVTVTLGPPVGAEAAGTMPPMEMELQKDGETMVVLSDQAPGIKSTFVKQKD